MVVEMKKETRKLLWRRICEAGHKSVRKFRNSRILVVFVVSESYYHMKKGARLGV